MLNKFLTVVFAASMLTASAQSVQKKQPVQNQKTAFQTGSPWIPEIDVRSDIAIIYGANDYSNMTFQERVKSWRDRGYQTHFMSGIAWGGYEDYFLGLWDGKNHFSEGQMDVKGDTIWHGKNVPYIVPVQSFIEYFKSTIIKKVIDNGISSIYLEEPEFWARGGYSPAFKDEWKRFYGFDWRPQHESAENTYLSNKLKYQMYYNAIKQVSEYAKEYGKSKGLDVKIYIPTHSLVNYSAWRIVSPEASLASLPSVDGYIGQVWTGTSREPTYFNGIKKERVFENAFLEYGSMVSMTAPTKRKVFLLTDPIEDQPRDWSDYKRNYEATFTAKILYPTVGDYEVMPWPERIYTSPYKVANSNESVLIPRHYSTQMQIMVNALNTMPLSSNKVSGSQGIGVLMGNSLMFQRFPTHKGFEDPAFSNFYGQTLPLVKRGIPVETVHIENLSYKASLDQIKVLIMSYSNMKPMEEKAHTYLADWVKKGGVLIYCGRDDDPYQSVMEWWNTKGNKFTTPSEHLFQLLGIQSSATDQLFTVGKGAVYIVRQNPKEFVMKAGGDEKFLSLVQSAYEKDAKAGNLSNKNYLSLQRGPYDIVSVMDENPGSAPLTLTGLMVDLFDIELPVLTKKVVEPGTQAFLYNLEREKDKTTPKVLASASRVSDEDKGKNSYSFVVKSPIRTTNSMRILLPAKPKSIAVSDSKGQIISDVKQSWDTNSKTSYLGFENSPEGVNVKITW